MVVNGIKYISSQWRRNEHDGVSNHRRLDCLLSCLFGRRSMKAFPRHWSLCREFTGDRWIPRTKGQLRGKCFHLMTSSSYFTISVLIIITTLDSTNPLKKYKSGTHNLLGATIRYRMLPKSSGFQTINSSVHFCKNETMVFILKKLTIKNRYIAVNFLQNLHKRRVYIYI